MPNIWSYRRLNEVIYVITADEHDHDLTEQALLQHTDRFLKKVLTTTNLRALDTEVKGHQEWVDVTVDWSQLMMIGIQTKKTLDERAGRNNEKHNPHANIHIKYYFPLNYAAHLPHMDRHRSEDFIVNTMARWHTQDENAQDVRGLFNEGNTHCWIAVKNIRDFIQGLPAVRLPTNKNIYIYTNAFEAALRDEHERRWAKK